MRRVSRQQSQGMRQQRKHRSQRALRPCWTSRQIHNQSLSCNPTNCTTKRREWSVLQAISPHPFRYALNQPLAHQPGSVRGHVPCRQPCPSGGDNQLRITRIVPQGRDDCIHLIGQDSHGYCTNSSGLQQPGDGWPGDIDLFAPGAAIADREHNRTCIGRKPLIHPYSLRRRPPATKSIALNNEKIERTVQSRFISWSIIF